MGVKPPEYENNGQLAKVTNHVKITVCNSVISRMKNKCASFSTQPTLNGYEAIRPPRKNRLMCWSNPSRIRRLIHMGNIQSQYPGPGRVLCNLPSREKRASSTDPPKTRPREVTHSISKRPAYETGGTLADSRYSFMRPRRRYD